MRFRAVFALTILALGSVAPAQTPKATPARDLDGIAVEVFKEMHNRGAELYNAGDASGCLKVYATALLTAKPFLKHRPAIQKAIDDGLADAEKADGAKLQAFALHKLFVKVRADLEAEAVSVEAPKAAQMTGTLTLDAKPLADAVVTLAGVTRAFTATTDAGGKFAFTDALPPGGYTAIVTGAGVPEKYGITTASGITVDLAAGKNVRDLALNSK